MTCRGRVLPIHSFHVRNSSLSWKSVVVLEFWRKLAAACNQTNLVLKLHTEFCVCVLCVMCFVHGCSTSDLSDTAAGLHRGTTEHLCTKLEGDITHSIHTDLSSTSSTSLWFIPHVWSCSQTRVTTYHFTIRFAYTCTSDKFHQNNDLNSRSRHKNHMKKSTKCRTSYSL